MKIYFDLAKKCLKDVDTENQVIFTGDVLVSKLEVISSAPTTDYYVVVSAKLSNGRTIGPFLYDAGGVQTDSHCTKWTFTLSSANGFTLTKGIVNFYIWLVPVNANDLNKKCIGAVAVNVGEAYGFEDSYFVELDSESQDVIANMSAQIQQLQTLIQNVNIIEPNPSSEATQDLLTIKIGSVTYSITEFRKFNQNDKFGDVIDEYLETDAPPFTANRQINLICEETGVFCHLEGYQSGADTYVELYVFGSDVAHLIFKNPNSTILNYTMSQIIQGTTATSVASLTGLKNEVTTLGATKENKKIDYIIYVTETYNQQTQEFEFTKTGEYGTFPFLFDDESNVDDLRKDLECLRVCIYVDTTRTSHAGQNIDVIELSLHHLSHPDDDSSTSAVFVGQQINGTNTNASIYQFEVDFCQDGMSDGGTENIDRYTLFNYKELHYVHTDNNFTNAYKTAVTKQGYDSSTDTFTPTAKINASNVDVIIKALKTYIDNGGANPVLLDSYLNDLEMILTAFPTGADATNKLATKNDLSTVFKYKGTVANYSDLPASGQAVGDVYNITNADSSHGIDAGDNVAWTGTGWDNLGGDVDLSNYQPKIDSSHKLSSDLVDDTNKANRFVKASSGVQKIQEGDNTEYGKVEVADNKAQLHAFEDTEGTGDVTATNSNVSVSYTTDNEDENTSAESIYNASGVVHKFTDANGDVYEIDITTDGIVFKKNGTLITNIESLVTTVNGNKEAVENTYTKTETEKLVSNTSKRTINQVLEIFDEGNDWQPYGIVGTYDHAWNVWHDTNGNTYCSNGTTLQKKWIRETATWEDVTWGTTSSTILAKIVGYRIVNIGDNTYCFAPYGTYWLDTNNTWSVVSWVSGSDLFLDGDYIWNDGTTTYGYMLVSSTKKYFKIENEINPSTNVVIPNRLKTTEVTFTGLPSDAIVERHNIWKDLDGNVYYSKQIDGNYQLNKETLAFTSVTFTGLSSFWAHNVWTDGRKIYWSSSTSQYEYAGNLNWVTKTWTGATPNIANNIWNDGIYCYLGYEYNQVLSETYVLRDIPVDQAYDPTSKNAQSGVAVAEAVEEAKAEIEENFAEASTDITDTTLYKISGVADALALPKKSQVEIVKIEGNSRKCSNLLNLTDYALNVNNNRYYNIVFKQTGSYTLSFNANIYQIELYGMNNTTGTATLISLQQGNTSFNFSITDTSLAYRLFIQTTNGVYDTNLATYNAMLNEGSTALPYEEYFEGIRNADTTELESCGVNIWDEEWEVGRLDSDGTTATGNAIRSKNYIQVIPNSTIYFYNSNDTNGRICYYDTSKNFISSETGVNTTFTISSNCHYIKFSTSIDYGTTYNHDICINYSNASINGNYYPYTHDSVNVGSDVLRSAGSVRDVKTADGSIVRKVGVVDLGDFNYSKLSDNLFQIYLTNAKAPQTNSQIANIFCSIYTSASGNDVYNKRVVQSIGLGTSLQLQIYDTNYNDETALKTALNGVKLYYELATPTTEQGTPFSSNALVVEMYGAEWQNGTTPLQVTKNYDISIKDQVLTNVEVDKKQSEQIKELQEKTIEPTLLWQNGSPTSSFAGQTITTADMSGFKYLIFEYKQLVSGFIDLAPATTSIKYKNESADMTLSCVIYDAQHFYSRKITKSTSSTLVVADCYAFDISSGGLIDNNGCVPVAIYGTNIL